MSDLLRLLGGCVFLALAALTAVAAPNQFLWKLSVAATEGGHWLAIGALVPAIPWRGQGRLGKVGAVMGLAAAALFVLPLFHASQMNKELPAMLDASFGTDRRVRGRFAEDLRPEPAGHAQSRVVGAVASGAAPRARVQHNRWRKAHARHLLTRI